ncbi:MAG: DMT family transporter [Betaproteobacteria bacterium]|nr:DMT family transporter [Betaproteobacteria bacterium]
MVVAGALFACMGVFVKLGAAHFSAAELAMYRSAVGLVLIGGMVLARGQTLATVHWRTHLLRGGVGFVSLIAYFYAVTQMPLATAMTLSYTAPLFLAAMTTLLLCEKFPPLLIAAIVLGFIGTALIFRPSASDGHLLPALLAVGSGFFAAWAYLNVRKLGRAGEPDWRIVFYFTLISTIGGALFQFVFAPQAGPARFSPITLQNAWILAGMGLCATGAQLALTRAYRLGNTLVVGALSYSTVVFACIAGFIVWRDVLPLMSWIGIAVIIAGGVLATQVETKAHGKVVVED